MKRRGKAIKQRTKVARRVTATKVRLARPPAKARPAPAPDLQRDLNAALEQLTATSEILRIISSASGELQPVFQAILANATRICEAKFGNLWLREGDGFRIAAIHGAPPKYREFINRESLIFPDPRSGIGVLTRTKKFVHVADIKAAPINEDKMRSATIKLANGRSLVGVPLLKDDEVVGAIVIYRQEVRRFTGKQIQLLTDFASQAVIAIENARLLNELRESLERQTATSEVLGVISRSKFELQPILQSVVDTAERLCRAEQTVIFRLEDGVYRFAAGHSIDPAYLEIERKTVISPGLGTAIGRAAMSRQVIRIDDAWTDPLYEKKDDAKLGGVRSMIGVPLMREGEAIGVIALARGRVEPFNDREIDLVATFADQAVIAIENVRLFDAEQQRTRELTESLEQQTATSEVLQVISSSPSDLEPVFATMLENAVRISGAKFGIIHGWDGENSRLMATHNLPPTFDKARRGAPVFKPGPKTGIRRMAATKSVIHISDLLEDESYLEDRAPQVMAAAELGGVRTMLAVPMLKENEVVGAFTVYRQEVRPFTDKQIDLVKNFANQAVIAIENARLLSELRESLAQQTATADVLRVISRSPGDLEPVFQAMLENATRLCEAPFGTMLLRDGGVLRIVARHVPPAPTVTFERGSELVISDNSTHPLVRVLDSKEVIHFADLRTDQSYIGGNPRVMALVDLVGARTGLCVPMLKDDECIGAFVAIRLEVRPFADKQIELVKNFASQAVIAIENARLLTELRQRTTDLSESLARQTATSDILRVISQSPTDERPVFNSIVLTATRLLHCDLAFMHMCDGATFLQAAAASPEGLIADLDLTKWPIDANAYFPARAIIGKKMLHLPDWSLIELPEHERNMHEMFGINSALYLPLLRKDQCLGLLTLAGKRPNIFGSADIGQAESFRDQALIAIENTRLFNETAEALEQQTATSEVLQVISSSPGDLQPVFVSMLENAVRICHASWGTIYRCEGDLLRLVATHDTPAAFSELRGRSPLYRHHPQDLLGRLMATKELVHFTDSAVEEVYVKRLDPVFVAAVELGGVRTALAVPMLKDDELIGAFVVARQEVRPFTDKEIALVQNFAAQAVIAIENTRLLTELRQRTDELETTLEYQTATSDVLKVISRSVFDLQKILEFVAETAARLCAAKQVGIFLLENQVYRFTIGFGLTHAYREIEERLALVPGRDTLVGRTALEAAPVQIIDALNDPQYGPKDEIRTAEVRTILGVPLTREGEVVGVIALARETVSAFSSEQIELVRTFADQAVIAIENARLLNELRQRTDDLTESLEQQTATSEVLQVISSSPGDLEPVFAAMLENAVRICDASFGSMQLREGDGFRRVALHNAPPEFLEFHKNAPVISVGDAISLNEVLTKKQVVHIADLQLEDPNTPLTKYAGARSLVVVPLLKEGEVMGAFGIYRQEVRPFTDKQIGLVQNFAAQAVIAIENTRLLSELRQRTDELGRSVGELRALGETSQAVNSTLDLQTVLATIVAKAVQLSRTEAGAIYVFDEGRHEFRLRATNGMDQGLIDALSDQHIGLDTANIEPAVSRGEPFQVADMREEAHTELGDIILRAGYRARLIAPLLRGEDLVGILVVRRKTPGAFPQNTVDLMKTFAAQSALAIQNARLFQEIDEKGRELEVASRHKSQFLANMSHELRTPLNAILGYTELILDSIYGDPPDKMRAVLERVQTNGKHLLGLINDVLDLSKIEAGQLTLSLTDYSLANLVQGVYVAVEPLAAQKNLALTTNVAPSLPAGHGDERRLSQVLLNLVGNAIKFTDKGEVAIEASVSNGSFQVAVRDSGPGIAAADQVKIFEEFQQVDNTLTKQKGGTGLGLAISKRIVEMHGGGISVDSELGKGSTFTIRLPVHAGSEGQAA
jgi:GAF domain-containing protein